MLTNHTVADEILKLFGTLDKPPETELEITLRKLKEMNNKMQGK